MDAVTSEFSSWVKLHTNEMYHYTFLKINDKQIAEDIVQNTFLAAVESYAKFKHESHPKTWLYSILKHKIADYYRLKYKNNVEMASDITDKFFFKKGRWNPSMMSLCCINSKNIFIFIGITY